MLPGSYFAKTKDGRIYHVNRSILFLEEWPCGSLKLYRLRLCRALRRTNLWWFLPEAWKASITAAYFELETREAWYRAAAYAKKMKMAGQSLPLGTQCPEYCAAMEHLAQ